METEPRNTAVYQALARIQSQVGPVLKTKKNEHFKYKYADLESLMAPINELVAENGCCTLESVEDDSQVEGRENLSRVRLELGLIHAASGQRVFVRATGYGDDRSDKGIFKATTGARKYAYALMFRLVTTDDPEKADVQEKKTAKTSAVKAIKEALQTKVSEAREVRALDKQYGS